MSIQTIDNAVFENVDSRYIEMKPFTSKQWLKIEDSNSGGSYTNAQLVFETNKINNTGAFINYAEAYLSFPMVGVLSGALRTAADGDTAINCGSEWLDYVMALKNSAMANIIHNITIEHGGKTRFSISNYANQYINFVLHSTLSEEDENIFGPTIGYAKDSSDSWRYSNAAGTAGIGLYNNINNKVIETDFHSGDIMNEGLLKRQKHFIKSTNGRSKNTFMGTDSQRFQFDGINTIVDDNNRKVYYYDCIVPLKYICPSLFDYNGLGLVRGADIRITVTINAICDFRFAKLPAAAGISALTFYDGSFINQSASETNMWMVASSTQKYRTTTDVDSPALLASARGTDYYTDCGSSPLLSNTGANADGTTLNANCYTFSSRLVTNGTYRHSKTRCTLNLPAYTLQPLIESQYLGEGDNSSKRIHEITVLNSWYKMFLATTGSQFSNTVSNSVVRPKRLIMIAQIANAANNAGINVLKSPFWTSVGHTCPFSIINFQCNVGGRPIYNISADNYSFKQYVAELNGAQGLNGGQITGLSSGRINFKDFNGLYHYLVVDLSRKDVAVENIPVSVEVSGQINSPFDINFHCYLEFAETYYTDVSNGAITDGVTG